LRKETHTLEFFTLLPPEDAVQKYLTVWRPPPPAREMASLDEAAGRVLAQDVRAEFDVPSFSRSTVDGYAVRAQDTFGATEPAPALFTVIGEVGMGEEAQVSPGPGEAVRVATGAMLPTRADAVVMVEQTEDLGGGSIAVVDDVAPGDNVISRGEDLASGEVLLRTGHRLRAQDIGALAALGMARIPVFERPTVVIISTGDEIVPPGEEPGPAQVRDINGPALVAAVRAAACKACFGGIVKDDEPALLVAMRSAVERGASAVVLSGGSSVGPLDLTPRIIDALGPPGVVVHGLAAKPGKPTILGLCGGMPVFGLPGHPASALVVFDVVIAPLLRVLCGEAVSRNLMEHLSRAAIEATLDRSLSSSPGREDYIRVRLERRGSRLFAVPVLGKSGLISTLAKADGMIRIPLESGGIEAGQTVRVMLWRI
jgi:molybdopterin molybdotransferase